MNSGRATAALAMTCGAALACGGTPGLASITLAPATLALFTGETRGGFTVTAFYDDGSRKSLFPPDVSFENSAPAVATIGFEGAVHAVAPGTATLTVTTTASSGAAGRTASATITVTDPPPTLVSLTVMGATTELVVGSTAHLAAAGIFSDGSLAVLTSGVSFASLAPGIATVSASGLVTGAAPGLTTVTASASGGAVTASLAVSVVGARRDVFVDGLASNLNFVPFDGTASSDLAPDSAVLLPNGHKTLRFTFPQQGSIGGAFVSSASSTPDLSGYDAVTFWAKASAPLSLGTVGLGNDASGTAAGARYAVETAGLSLDTTFRQFILPLPLAAKLAAEPGLFHFVDTKNVSAGAAVSFWLGDLRYQTLGATATGAPAPAFTVAAHAVHLGTPFALASSDLQVSWTGGLGPAPLTLVNPGLAYFTYSSSDASVATVDADGVVTGVKAGQASLTSRLGAVQTTNVLALTVGP